MKSKLTIDAQNVLRSRRMSSLSVVAVALLMAYVGMLNGAQAAPTDFDPTFGTGGKVLTNFISSEGDIVIQPDGKIIAAGNTIDSTLHESLFAVMRFNIDGTLDRSFDRDGKVSTRVGDKGGRPYAVALQPDGKIVVIGYSKVGEWTGSEGVFGFDFAVVRYNSDGSLDTSFDGDGVVTTDFASSQDKAVDVAIQPDGKIVVVGTVWVPGWSNIDFAVARYNSDGSLDTRFSLDGKLTTKFFNSMDYATAIALQSDGKAVVVGDVDNSSTVRPGFGLARYNVNGALDTSFEKDGRVATNLWKIGASPNSVLIQPDGKIVVAGSAIDGTSVYGRADFGLARYNSDGSLDLSFGEGGKVITPFSSGGITNDIAYDLARQPDGKFVAVGSAVDSEGLIHSLALARYNRNGSLDAGFGAGGQFTTTFGPHTYSDAHSVALQDDGKIVIAGRSYNTVTNVNRFVIARFMGGAALGQPALSSLDLNLSMVVGGNSTYGKVTLTAPAPAGGTVVSLSDTNAASTVPANVIVPAGAVSQTFDISTSVVTAIHSGSVKAALGEDSFTKTLTVRPIGVRSISLTPNPVTGANTVTATVVLERAAAPGNITVTLASSNPSVATPTVSTISIPAGVVSKTFSVRTADVTTSSTAAIKATANGVSKSAVLTVYKGRTPAIKINSVNVKEGPSVWPAYPMAVFTVSLTAASQQTVTVKYSTANGTATTADYTPIPMTLLTFAPGETSKTISVQITTDVFDEPNETFKVLLATPTNATLAVSEGIGTILDEDPTPKLTINDINVTEGTTGTSLAGFTVRLSGYSLYTITVHYATANGTATAPADYVATSGTVTFAPGETSKKILVTIKGDTVPEGIETFKVNLSAPANATISDGIATCMISNGSF